VPPKLALVRSSRHADLQVEPQTKLPEMLPGEQVIEDYRYLSLSLKAHPVSFLREEFRKIGITRNVDLLKCARRQKGDDRRPRAGASAAGFGQRALSS
jgi:error-prone DNA polymerase